MVKIKCVKTVYKIPSDRDYMEIEIKKLDKTQKVVYDDSIYITLSI